MKKFFFSLNSFEKLKELKTINQTIHRKIHIAININFDAFSRKIFVLNPKQIIVTEH